MQIVRLYISDDHNYVGHHGQPAGENPILEVEQVECVAGRGIRGDRYFKREENFKGQITFFAEEMYDTLREQFLDQGMPPSVFRRNVITRGADLNELIGKEFEIQGIRFFGTEECRPCYWMDQAIAPGAEDAMRGNGGLRAKILSGGTLAVDASGSS